MQQQAVGRGINLSINSRAGGRLLALASACSIWLVVPIAEASKPTSAVTATDWQLADSLMSRLLYGMLRATYVGSIRIERREPANSTEQSEILVSALDVAVGDGPILGSLLSRGGAVCFSAGACAEIQGHVEEARIVANASGQIAILMRGSMGALRMKGRFDRPGSSVEFSGIVAPHLATECPARESRSDSEKPPPQPARHSVIGVTLAISGSTSHPNVHLNPLSIVAIDEWGQFPFDHCASLGASAGK